MFLSSHSRGKTLWQHLMERKEASPHLEQRMSLILGLDPATGEVISLPRRVINSTHTHVSGSSNAGKSLTALLNLFLQLVRGYRLSNGKWSPKSPIFFFDLKGDRALFHAAKFASEADGRMFRYFSTFPRTGYFFFDPFQSFASEELTAIEIATGWIRGLELDYGFGYGRNYYTDQNLALLAEAIQEMLKAGSPSLGVISRVMGDMARQPAKNDARHIKSVVDILAKYPQINQELHADRPYPVLDFAAAIANGDVCHITLPCNNGGSPLRQIAGLMLSNIIFAVQSLRNRGTAIGPVYIFVDEFYHIAGNSFGDLLSTAREWDIHFIIANQDNTQLNKHDPNLPSIVRTNTDVKLIFSANNPDDRRYLQEQSGMTTEFPASYTIGSKSSSVSYSEKRDWSLDINALDSVNDSSAMCFLLVNDGMPHDLGKRVRALKTLYPLALTDYVLFHDTPLPETPNYTLKQSGAEGTSATVTPRSVSESGEHNLNEAESLQERLKRKFIELSDADSLALSP